MDDRRNKISGIIRLRGPVLPSDIAKEIGCDLIISSAILSDMVGDKLLRASRLKVGGSPLYFLPDQTENLENFINYLPSKEKEVFDYLKEKTLVNDSRLDAAFKVAIRNLNDFAFPIKVSVDSKEHIFWRFHSLPNETAIDMIKRKFEKRDEKEKHKQEQIKQEKKAEQAHQKAEEKREHATKQKEQQEKKAEAIAESIADKTEKHIFTKPKAPAAKTEKALRMIEAFKAKIEEYANANKISLIKELSAEKDYIELISSLNSDVGQLQYLIIAKNKKKINDADIIMAYQQGQNSKLPVLFISTGSLTKKAESCIGQFKGYLLFRKL